MYDEGSNGREREIKKRKLTVSKARKERGIQKIEEDRNNKTAVLKTGEWETTFAGHVAHDSDAWCVRCSFPSRGKSGGWARGWTTLLTAVGLHVAMSKGHAQPRFHHLQSKTRLR